MVVSHNEGLNLVAQPQPHYGYGIVPQEQTNFHPQIHEASVSPYPNSIYQTPGNYADPSVPYSNGFFPTYQNMPNQANYNSGYNYNNQAYSYPNPGAY